MSTPVLSMIDSTNRVNEAIVIPKPEELISEDGRIFEIMDWEPSVILDCMVTIKIKVNVKLPEES